MDPARNKLLENLLEACARRDQGAFARLYEVTAPKLFGVAVRILRREDWAEEVLQDCYVSIWNNAGRYAAGLSAPMTWMTSIVRNRCLDWLRRPNLEVVLQRPDDNGDDPLEAKQRQAIMLAFYDGLSHSELASHMRQPLGTVKTWVRRGLEKLKGCLGSA